MARNKSHKLPFIIVIVTAVFLYGFSFISDTLSTVRVPIICYHHLDPDYQGDSQAIVTPEKFKDDLTEIKKAGFTTIFFEDLFDYTDSGVTLPEKPIIITLDDGYLSNYQYAYPIIKELDMKVTVSLIGSSVGNVKDFDTGKPIIPHFNWVQAREMYDSGLVDFQSHSYDMHGDGGEGSDYRKGVLQKADESTEEYTLALRNDCLIEKDLIEKKIGNSVSVFFYPYGEYTALSEQVLRSLGYKATVVLGEGISEVSRSRNSLYMLKRIVAGNSMTSRDLVEKISNY